MTATPSAQKPTAFDTLFRTYESGDYDVLVRALPTRKAYQALERDLERARLAWRKDWRRVQAVFLLELATVAFRQSWPDRKDVLTSARAFLLLRPGRLGEFRDEDLFEILWHRAALAILHGSLNASMMEEYLLQMERRIGPTPATFEGQARLVEPRLALIHAQAAELSLLPGTVRVQTTLLAGRAVQSTSIGANPAQVNDTLVRFDDAAAFDVNRAEAAVRRANVLVRTNRSEAALPLLTAHAGELPDKLLQYWRDLLRARALDILDRLDDAAQAYSAARALAPTAQSPILALSVLRFRQGNLAEAHQFTDLVRQLPPDADDPWALYWYGDSRFFPRVLTSLREMAK